MADGRPRPGHRAVDRHLNFPQKVPKKLLCVLDDFLTFDWYLHDIASVRFT
jgi:hypothetical protein